MSDKFKHRDKGFQYFIGNKDDIARPMYILPQMSGYIKYFENGGKNMSFMTEDDSVLVKIMKFGTIACLFMIKNT